MELARILLRHPEAEITSITGRSMAGKDIGEVFPHLAELDMTITEDITESVDVVFSALPHAASAERLAPLIRDGVKAVDISADFRLKDLDEYEAWYGTAHPCPELLEEAVYGLPELHRDEIEKTSIVGNPGCYPSASILALAPALKAGIIEPDIIIDAKSGVSGAGRGFSLNTHYSEVNESVKAYGVDGHRHLPEIAQELSLLSSNGKVNLTFMPHLIPMTRGIFASCYAPLKEGAISSGEDAIGEVKELYNEFYKNEPFAKVVTAPPATKHTLGNNDCVIYPTVDTRTNRLMVFSCLDNLVKGAAGQAVQNMNLMFDLPEDEGLRHVALYP
ncbi:MAG: N-acetyl-gamma-glutamyl-phosphate reductase [Chloroflexi bacterium]|nr:N-acetyl-gamma-glutamyl-phosphate reductase [Chloroflexota bacterium]